MNVSPPHLFDRQLAVRWTAARVDWYAEVAPDAYRHFYSAVRDQLSSSCQLPPGMSALTPADREAIRSLCTRVWPGDLEPAYRTFARTVAERTVDRWRVNLAGRPEQEAMAVAPAATGGRSLFHPWGYHRWTYAIAHRDTLGVEARVPAC
jgi:hypothetical protein